ncbi:hypothetical protein HXX76_015797 [Chlamydomonas incerta]|uniref:Methyltransferase domain-containing protein n=1 Tax=Chlamydomonas incerta TaxID=51695 RepID=A0A835SDL0_CHLIN|nr:hypothetical protein HXX76_015797 [Chlamydomonas incerta]|eukprot:KAG2422777.1 hypothetical protein HXX76_015797 [Chlamydomonas incerta]
MKTPRTVEFHEKGVPAGDIFTRIYGAKLWGTAGGGSGIGSEPNCTQFIRPKIVSVLQRYNVQSMVDAPCGSMAWMPLVLEQVPNVTYTGMDVACNLIAEHQINFANRTNWRCEKRGLARFGGREGLPRADLVFSRDALQHLPLSYVHSFLRNVRDSGARYLLVGSYLNETSTKFLNLDIRVGEYYDINLLEKPFSLRHALLETLDEEYIYSGFAHKSMLLLDATKL